MAIWATLEAQAACKALREAGLAVAPGELRIALRDDRWAVALPGERMAWLPASAAGSARLAVERKVLRLLADRCSFSTPRIVFESQSGFDIRALVSGLNDPWGLYERLKTDRAWARRIGNALGTVLVEQHTRITQPDVAGWLPLQVKWPQSGDWVRSRLPHVINDKPLLGQIDAAFRRYEHVLVSPDDRVLVHADLGLHNVVVDPATAELRGVFDYDDAAWADRHYDFRYLIFHAEHEEALEAALSVYEPALGRHLDRNRIHLYNAACAIGFLAYRYGVAPHEKWCGRTLAEDLSWVRNALARLAIG
jgi:hypothetical protein